MKKLWTALVALILSLSLFSGALAAPDYLILDGDGVTGPITKEKIEIDVVISQGATQGNADEIWLWKYFEEVLNVKVNVEQVADAKEYRNLALASGDFPDIMINMNVSTSDIVNYGQEEGMFLKIDEYIDEYMPNLKAIYEEHPDYRAAIEAPDGHIYALGGIADPNDETRNTGLHIYEKSLKELGLKTPETLDELVEVLRAMKAANPESTPYSGSYANYNPGLVVLTALGFNTSDAKGLSPALRNGKVVFPFGDRETYGEFLRVLNTFYTEGIMSHDFFTLTSTQVFSTIAEGKGGLFAAAPWNASPDIYMDWNALKPLTSAYNDTPIWPANMGALTCNRWVINAETEYPELCCKLADFFFNKTGLVYAFYGPMTTETDILFDKTAGWYWDDATDWIIYPDLVNDAAGIYGGMENHYRQGKIMLFTGVQFGDYRTFFEDVAEHAKADYRRVWSYDSPDFRHYAGMVDNQKPYYTQGYPKNVFFDVETNERVIELKSVIDAYVEAETAKFITGARALNEEELNKYFDGLDAIGYQEYLQYYVDYYAAK